MMRNTVLSSSYVLYLSLLLSGSKVNFDVREYSDKTMAQMSLC